MEITHQIFIPLWGTNHHPQCHKFVFHHVYLVNVQFSTVAIEWEGWVTKIYDNRLEDTLWTNFILGGYFCVNFKQLRFIAGRPYVYFIWRIQNSNCGNKIFVKEASLFFTKRDYERRRREIVITSAKHEAERSVEKHYCKWGRHSQN